MKVKDILNYTNKVMILDEIGCGIIGEARIGDGSKYQDAEIGSIMASEDMLCVTIIESETPAVDKIERIYTGGGIYCYRGQFADGRFFVGDGDLSSYTKTDPFAVDWETLLDWEWQRDNELEDGPEVSLDAVWDSTPDEKRIEG